MISDGMGAFSVPARRGEDVLGSLGADPLARGITITGPASETMSREYLQWMYDAKMEGGARGNRLNSSVWQGLAEGFEGREWGMTPLDGMLVGASRVSIF